MSQPSLTKQEPPRSRQGISLGEVCAALIIIFLVSVISIPVIVGNHDNPRSSYQTPLEQEATRQDLRAVNVQICGVTDGQILTPRGVFEADAVKFPVKLWGAYEFAVDGNKLVLYGPANPEHSVPLC